MNAYSSILSRIRIVYTVGVGCCHSCTLSRAWKLRPSQAFDATGRVQHSKYHRWPFLRKFVLVATTSVCLEQQEHRLQSFSRTTIPPQSSTIYGDAERLNFSFKAVGCTPGTTPGGGFILPCTSASAGPGIADPGIANTVATAPPAREHGGRERKVGGGPLLSRLQYPDKEAHTRVRTLPRATAPAKLTTCLAVIKRLK